MSVINLDHMSANPLLPEVQEAMIDAIKGNYGNPSSQQRMGEQAAEILENSRKPVARLINAAARINPFLPAFSIVPILSLILLTNLSTFSIVNVGFI